MLYAVLIYAALAIWVMPRICEKGWKKALCETIGWLTLTGAVWNHFAGNLDLIDEVIVVLLAVCSLISFFVFLLQSLMEILEVIATHAASEDLFYEYPDFLEGLRWAFAELPVRV